MGTLLPLINYNSTTPYFYVSMYFYVTSYVICRVSLRCMPNWQLVLGDFFPLHGDFATDRRPQDDSQTDQVPDQLYYYYDILFLLIYQSFFLLLNSHFYDKMLLFLLH